MLLATVVGGRPDPYHVTITVETVSRPDDLGQIPERAHVARLIPRADELLFSCTCPDWDDPCKHGVAALLALAAELGSRPELLVYWRCGDADDRPRTKVGSRAKADRHLRLVPPAPPPSPFETPEWHEFAGDELAIPQCDVADRAVVVAVDAARAHRRCRGDPVGLAGSAPLQPRRRFLRVNQR